jgi:succinate dehydrogenase (ubiquinone) cytochrome b560 subunit
MALSTMRFAMRSCLVARQTFIMARFAPMTASMATKETTPEAAHKEMQKFWDKNLAIGRPNSPWWIYRPHLPMLTSLCHRATGIAMGVAFYALSIGVFVAPGDFPSYVEFIKNLHLSPLLLFPAKTIVAFPLVYHYINGLRHLTWDAGHGYELKTQYKSGTIIVISAITVSALLASVAYW